MPLWPFNRDPKPFLPAEGDPPSGEPQAPPPRYVDESTFQKALDDVRSTNAKLDVMMGFFTGHGQQAQPAQEPPEAPIPDISDDEYTTAIYNSDAAKIRIRHQADIERSLRAERKTTNARLALLEQQGMGILDRVSTEVGQTSLATQPYYQLLKTDIDAALGTIPAHQRTPEMRTHIYNAIVGANLDKIRAHDAAEATRIQASRQDLDPPGRRSSRDAGPTPESVFGERLLDQGATWHGGGRLWQHTTPDAWFQRHYTVPDAKAAAVYATNVMNLDNCETCFGPVIGGKCHCKRS